MMKHLFFLTVVLTTLLLHTPESSAFEQKEKSCGSCHAMTIHEAANILQRLLPNTSIISVKDRPMPGLWEVVFESNDGSGKRGLTYISYNKRHVFTGFIVDLKK